MAIEAIVVVPARDEEAWIGSCLAALARQTIGSERFETVLVLDACADATAAVASRSARALGLRLTLLDGPGRGVGAARRAGMELAAERLCATGMPDGLIACTDADTEPSEDWLERQLAYVSGGVQAIAGDVLLDELELVRLPVGARRRREREAAQRLSRIRRHDPGAAHHHCAGASLGVTAAAYRAVGGLEPVSALEDSAFAERLAAHGIDVVRAADVRVRTSARLFGRARRGLSLDLAVSVWCENRRYTADTFTLDWLLARSGQTSVAVIVPTKECAGTIAGVLERTVAPLAAAGVVTDVVVVDANSRDGTAEVARRAGARVVQQDAVLPRFGSVLGKGDAMWRALAQTHSDIVCFLDGDTVDPDPRHLQGLIGPFLLDPAIALVKGSYARPLQVGSVAVAHEGGRVTELMARPLLNLHEPQLAGFTQPLAGEFAARRSLLETLPFPVGYGVEIALLIDALRAVGLEALAECDLGTRQNRHQPLRALGEMAYAVLAAVERRSGEGRGIVGGHYLRPWDDGTIVHVPVAERPPLATLAADTSTACAAAGGFPLTGDAEAV